MRHGDDEPPAEVMEPGEQTEWHELLRPALNRMIETGVDQVTITRDGFEARVRFKPRPKKTIGNEQ